MHFAELSAVKAGCAFFQGVNWWYLIGQEVWVLSVGRGGFHLPGNSGRPRARQRGALGSHPGAFRADL